MDDDESAITALFEMQSEGWESGDADLFASAFAQDAEFFNITSQALKGREAIASHHKQLWATAYNGVAPEITERRVRFLRPDVATIESRAVLKLPGGERRAHLLAFALKTDGKWELHALHNMLPFVPPGA